MPKPGRVKLRPPKNQANEPWERRVVRGGDAYNPNRILLGPEVALGPSAERARTRFREVEGYFSSFPFWEFVKPLGWGGNGLALKYHYLELARRKDFNMVVKVSLYGWEDSILRDEITAVRHHDRAAHCVQGIEPGYVGLPPRPPYGYDIPSSDDSSSSSESSGSESREDVPSREHKLGRARKKLDQNELKRKWSRHRKRIRLARLRGDAKDAEMRRRGMEPVRGYDPDNPDDPWHRDYLLLEFCENGDLEGLIGRLGEAEEMAPNRVLWAFWLCMVRACVAMAYPPRKFHPRRREGPPVTHNMLPGVDINREGKIVGRELFEDIPVPRRRWAAKKLVHFDIDPNNIFISNVDFNAIDNEHLLIPKLKLGDFGLATEVKWRKRNIYYAGMRRWAKYGYYAPEQFGPEWEHIKTRDGEIPEEDGPEISEQKIAGNYGPQMNIWGIGITMWQLITRLWVPLPPTLMPKSRKWPGLPDTYAVEILTNPLYDGVDVKLRETVARCMAHDPAQRPTLPVLLKEAKKGIDKRFANETDQFIRDWVDRMIYNVPDW
ncbi:kinase-like domain-containing protein [Poronia punctata]|nr:kinase-like domain-containing protein [Poronia punctata]